MQAAHHVPVTQTPTRDTRDTLAISAIAMRDALLSLAQRPLYGVTLALAGVVAHSWTVRGPQYLPLYGLDAATTHLVLQAHFPGCMALLVRDGQALAVPTAFADALELEDLVNLLVEHRALQDEDSRWLAHAIATACLGDDHLWQDMNLPARAMLSDLLHGFFTSLAVRNRQDMKWKKFLYLQLCERADIRVCKSPSCGVCTDYTVCFSSEV